MNAALFPDLIVNGEEVPHALVAAEAQNHSAPRGKPGLAWRKAARAMAIRTLLLQEARRRDVEAEALEIAPGKFETEEEALIRGLLDTTIQAEVPSEDAVRAEWERDPDRFHSPPLWEVSHILIACDPRDEEAAKAARLQANDIANRLAAGGVKFAVLAHDHSECGSKSAGGSLGQLGPGDTVPEFEAALRDLSEGQISDPVLTRHGWHLIRMDASAPGQVLPFASVQGKIAEAMEKASWETKARELVDELVKAADVSGVTDL